MYFPPGLNSVGFEIDLSVLVKAIAAKEAPINLLRPADCALNQMARAMKQELRLPGVRVVEERIASQKG